MEKILFQRMYFDVAIAAVFDSFFSLLKHYHYFNTNVPRFTVESQV